MELPTGFSSSLYRLARHPPTGRPARDYLGNLLYVPLADDVPPAATSDSARIVGFPTKGAAGRRSRRAGEETKDTYQLAPTSKGSAGTGFPLDEDVTG